MDPVRSTTKTQNGVSSLDLTTHKMNSLKTSNGVEEIKPVEKPQASHKKYFFANPFFKWTVIILSELIIVIAVFSLGIKVGRHEEHFSKAWIQNYPRNFGGPKAFVVPIGAPVPLIQPHGIFGNILSKSSDSKSLVIKGQDNIEKTIEIESGTTIQKGFTTIKVTDLKDNDSVIVIGEPSEQGEIDAKFIRVLN